MTRTSRYFNRQRQENPTWPQASRPRLGGGPTANKTTSGRHLDATPEMERWEVDMHETARELKAQLDSKMSALQALIAEANRVANRLETAVKNKDNTDDTPPSNRIRSGGSPLFNPENGNLPKEENKRSSLPTTQAEALHPAQAATASRKSPQYRQTEIYTLADHGLNDSAIAQRLGMPIGEVELILSLRGKR